MEWQHYFEPLSLKKPEKVFLTPEASFSQYITVHTQSNPIPDISGFDIAIVGVPDGRDTMNSGTSSSPDAIRNSLYQLSRFPVRIKIIDLGNLMIKDSMADTYFGLRDVLIELISRDIQIVILGGGQSLTWSTYLAFRHFKQKLNLVTIDAKIDAGDYPVDCFSETFMSKIIGLQKEEQILFDYTNIGHQAHLNDYKVLEKMAAMNLGLLRLGAIRSQYDLIESVLRDAHMISVDMGVVKHSDCPANFRTSPNGLSGDEICQIARYAGTSESARCFGIFELNTFYDQQQQSANLAAQMIWYYIDGIINKRLNHQRKDLSRHLLKISDHEIVFYKCKLTDRWWVDVPIIKSNTCVTVSCSAADYKKACSDEIPDRWWRLFRKLNS